MKINAKSFRKAMSLVLTFAILMSVCAVMLTTFASANATGAQTYVYNFRKDSDGTNNYVEGVNYKLSGGGAHTLTDFKVTDQGLRIDVTGTRATSFGTNLTLPGFFLSDPDVNVGDANGLKFESGKDYGIVIKYKVLNETAAKAAADELSIAANSRLNFTMLVTQEGTIDGKCASSLAMKGSQPSDVFKGTDLYTQTQIVCETSTGTADYVDGEWHYYTIAVDGDNAYGRTALTDSSNQYLKIFVAGIGAQFLIESATVTVMDCANNHFESQGATQTTEFKKMTVKDDSATPNKVAGIRYMLPGDSLQGLVSGVDKTKEAYNTTTGNNNVVAPSSDTVYNLSSFRTKTEKFVYDFTSATVAAAYEGGTHADHLSNNGNGGTPGATLADDGVALPSKVVATGNTDTTYTEPGLWFTSTANGNSTAYSTMHKVFLYGCADANAFTRTTAKYSNALVVSSNKNYRVEVEYKYVKDSQKYLTNTMNDVVLAVSSAVDGAESGSTFLIVDTSAIDTADKTNYHTAVFEFDSDATPVSGYTLHGGRLCIGTNGGASIIINKVTVYVADKDTTAGAEVFATVDGAEKKLTVGQTLVTPTTKANVASTGWYNIATGERLYTAKGAHFVEYDARYDSGLSVYQDFNTGTGGYYAPRIQANQTYQIVDSGYADHGKALKFTGSNNASNAFAHFIPTKQSGTTETPYTIEAGKKYTVSFDLKVLQANTDSTSNFHMVLYLVDDSGINASGHKTQVSTGTNGSVSEAYYNLGYTAAVVKGNASSSDWLNYSFTFTAPETLTTCASDSLVQNIPALHFWYGANNGASTVTAEVMIDNLEFADTSDPYGNVAQGVKSSIRAEDTAEDGAYTTAGIRFRTRINQSDVWGNDETGFVVIPEALIATAEQAMGGKWYDMTKTSSLREVAITSYKDNSGIHYTIYDNAPETGKYDLQLLVKGLTQEGSAKNLKSNNIVAVFYIKKVDAETEAVSYTYRFVKSASYNEVKQMYVDAGVTGANAY